MGRLNGGKDYSSVRVNYSKSGSTLFLSFHGVFRCVRYVMGTAGAVRLKIRTSHSAEARLAVVSADRVGPSLFGAVLCCSSQGRPAAT